MGYYGNVGGFNNCCENVGNYNNYCGREHCGNKHGSTFALIIVLFILLIIIGATMMHRGY